MNKAYFLLILILCSACKMNKKTDSQDGNMKHDSIHYINVGIGDGQEGDVFEIVEEMPEFPGGQNELNKFINKNLHYPEIAHKKGLQGNVIVQIIIDKDGSVTKPKIIRSVEPSLDNEALRIIGLMPKWKPGKQKEKVLKVRYTFPIQFKID